MLVADTATIVTAIFAAVAALAAWATVATNWFRQRAAREPNVSAGFLDQRGAPPTQTIEFVNAGPGLAIGLTWGMYEPPRAGYVGTGHLQAGERYPLPLVGQFVTEGKTVDFVWTCRDVDQRMHVWSYAGDHKRLRKGKYPDMRECFQMMYPNVKLPPRK